MGIPRSPATEERLMSTESRLDGMHTRFDELTDRIVDITGRMGNMVQLLQTLARVCGGGGGAAQSFMITRYPRRIANIFQRQEDIQNPTEPLRDATTVISNSG